MHNINDLKKSLLENLAPFLEHKFPEGQWIGTEYALGNVSGKSGNSLKIETRGDKTGLWCDWNGKPHERGDIFDLLIQHYEAKGKNDYTLESALSEVAAYLNKSFVPRIALANPPKQHPVPQIQPSDIKTTPEVQQRVNDYLVNQRLISPEVLSKYHVTTALGTGENEGEAMMVFPNVNPQNQLIAINFLGIDKIETVLPDGEIKTKHRVGRYPKGAPQILWGWQAIPENARYVVITEGQIDCLTWATMGHPALSLSNGVKGMSWIEHELQNLSRFERIYLHSDNEPEAVEYRKEISTRLGSNRVYIVPPRDGYKDANDWIKAGAKPEHFLESLSKADTLHPSFIVTANDVWDEVVQELFPTKDNEGFPLPWKADDGTDTFRLMLKQTSIIAGTDFSGKSLCAQNIMAAFSATGIKVGIISMEFPPEETFAWLTECVSARDRYNLDLQTTYQVRDWINDRIFLVKANEGFTLNDCQESVEWLRAIKGCQVFLVDSLTTFDDVDETDNKQQIRAIKRLVKMSAQTNSHITVVAHTKKPYQQRDGSYEKENRSSIRGASALKDLTQTIFIARRNWEKKDALREVLKVHQSDEIKWQLFQQTWAESPDLVLDVDKHRKTGHTPTFSLWFHKCRQYTSSPQITPFPYYAYNGSKEDSHNWLEGR